MDNKKTKDIKINHENFVKENTGNIKEFYKISSCIGRGNELQYIRIIEIGPESGVKVANFAFLCNYLDH